MSKEGLSSQSTTSLSNIRQSAPIAKAFNGMPYFLQTGAMSNRAENCGTPLPATILSDTDRSISDSASDCLL